MEGRVGAVAGLSSVGCCGCGDMLSLMSDREPAANRNLDANEVGDARGKKEAKNR